MEQDDEPTVLEYARHHGLANAHLQHHALSDAFLNHKDAELNGLEDDPWLFKIEDHATYSPDTRLQVDGSVTHFLAAITNPPSEACQFDEECQVLTNPRRSLKQELPLLRTDHEEDLRQFVKPFDPSLADEHLPLEGLDDELDEGLGWPSSCFGVSKRIEQECWAEKLVVSRKVLPYLDEIMGIQPTEEIPTFDDQHLPLYKGRKALDPVTPPLLPQSWPPSPYQPSSTTGRLESLSEQSSPTKKTLKDIEQRMLIHEQKPPKLRVSSRSQTPRGQLDDETFEGQKPHEDVQNDQDEMLLDAHSIGDLYSPLKGVNVSPDLAELEWRRSRPSKVEVPMTPPNSKTHFMYGKGDDLLDIAMKSISQSAPISKPEVEPMSSQELDAFFAKTIEPVATKAEQAIMQEQLQETDTVGRVTVPVMDFTLPLAPWKKQSQTVLNKPKPDALLSEMQKLHLANAHWPAMGKLERKLRWAPFPAALGRVEIQEELEGANALESFLEVPDCVDSDTLVWKPDGLRLLDDLLDSDEEELSKATFPESTDMESLIRKRKLELQHRNTSSSDSDDDDTQHIDENSMAAMKRPSKRQKTAEKTKHHVDCYPMCGKDDTAGNMLEDQSLEQFLALRKGVFVDSSKRKQGPKARLSESGEKAMTGNSVGAQVAATDEHPPRQPPPGSTALGVRNITPAPDLVVPATASSFIISTSFLKDRKLAREIERLYPTAELIERDLSLHVTSIQQQAKGSNMDPVDTMGVEADMILSPSTGLLLTTFQKIKQRALPGQKTDSFLRQRIARAAPRYEMLLILVTHDRLSEVNDSAKTAARLGWGDCEVLTDFMAFCAGVQAGTQVHLVGSDTQHLAKWVVSFMVRYRLDAPNIKMLHEETLWEIFLRRAGLNVFAAQVVCATLKEPPEEPKGDGFPRIDHGLKAFLKMSVEERLARFERLFGGRNLLIRVSHILDACWR